MNPNEPQEDDYLLITTTEKLVRTLLKLDKITPENIASLEKMLHSLENLPNTTRDIHVELGLCIRQGDETNSELKYWNWTISEALLDISSGGSQYDSSIGGDSYTKLTYIVEPGIRIVDGNVFQWIEEIENFLIPSLNNSGLSAIRLSIIDE